ncbi:MAG: FtsK/SpoIIIE domain-containing protein [Actinomycetes bacterium]
MRATLAHSVHLRLTMVDPDAGGQVDLAVHAGPGSTLGDVEADLLGAVDRAGSRVCHDGQGIDPATPLGQPPLVSGVVLCAGAASTPGPGRVELPACRGWAGPGWVLRAVGGPYAGSSWRLRPGRHKIGRSVTTVIRLDDPSASRVHAVVEVAPDASHDHITIQDLGSSHGTFVDAQRLRAGAVPLAPGSIVRVGDSLLRLEIADPVPLAWSAPGDGTVLVNLAPQVGSGPRAAEYSCPDPPEHHATRHPPGGMLMVPMVAGMASYWAFGRQPAYLLVALAGPILAGLAWLATAMHHRRLDRRARARHHDETRRTYQLVQAALRDEAESRRATDPDPATVLAHATLPGPGLWYRNESEDVRLRVGLARLPAVTTLRPARGRDSPAVELFVDDVPVSVSLEDIAVLGITGPTPELMRLARWVVGQVAGLYRPTGVELQVMVADEFAQDWAWTAWLPHLAGPAAPGPPASGGVRLGTRAAREALLRLTERVGPVLADPSAPDPSAPDGAASRASTLVVVIGGRCLPSGQAAGVLLGQAPRSGYRIVVADPDPRLLPAGCTALVTLGGRHACSGVLTGLHRADPVEMLVDGVGSGWAESLARALAPLRPSIRPVSATTSIQDRPVDRLPRVVGLQELLPEAGGHGPDVASRWARTAPTTRIPIGIGAHGPVEVDLVTDGPHLLVAGTTGSGKSELLRTLVAGLALLNRPDQAQLVLIDYKGGAAFAECTMLPHVVGVLTDLDADETARTLAGLGAELRRRERLLSTAGQRDIATYLTAQALQPDGLPPMPRLIIIVDEYATLADEVPDFLPGLIAVAQRGRSLGVHLVLATQRPGGRIGPDIRANTSLRIALRVADPAESHDVIDRPDACLLPRDRPGMAWVRTATGDAQVVQTAIVCRHVETGRGTSSDPPRVCAAPAWRPDWQPPDVPTRLLAHGPAPGAPARADRPEDGSPARGSLADIVQAVADATVLLGVRTPPGPWPTPLPAMLDTCRLPQPGPGQIVVGLCDRPEQMRQDAFALDLVHPRTLLAVGGPRSGRTTLLSTVAAQAAARWDPEHLHVYAFDATGGLAGLAALAHCGAVVRTSQVERCWRVVQLLHGMIHGTDQTDTVDLDPPHVLLLIDGWESVVDALDQVDHGQGVDLLMRTLAEAPGRGIQVVITAGPQAGLSRLSSLAGDRLVLDLPDPNDAVLVGVRVRAGAGRLPPGRGRLAPDGALVQVAVDGHAASAPGGADLDAPATCAPDGRSNHSTGGPRRVDEPPEYVEVIDVDRIDPGRATVGVRDIRPTLWAAVGLGGDDGTVVGVDLAVARPGLLVTGPPGSGRSSAAQTMGGWLARQGVRVVLLTACSDGPGRADRQSGLTVHVAGGPVGEATATAISEDLSRPGPVVLLVDDAHLLDTGRIGDILGRWTADPSPDHGLVVTSDPEPLVGAYRGLLASVRRTRATLILGGGPTAALLSTTLPGLTVPSLPRTRPGRGLLMVDRRLTPVQLPRSRPDDPAPGQATGPLDGADHGSRLDACR